MATVEIAFAPCGDKSDFGANAVEGSTALNVQTITSGAGNTLGSYAYDGTAGIACIVTATGGDVKVSFGSAADATSDATARRILDGQTRYFGRLVVGDKCAVTDA